MSKRGGSSSRWRQRQERDIYVERAAREGYRSRAAFKLEQILAKDPRVLRPGMLVVDLGAAPGSWSQLAARRVGPSGHVWALDLLPMDPVPGVDFIRGDFAAPDTLEALRAALGGRSVDLVMSDMAPNISGNRAIDQPRSMALADEALAFAREVLKRGGSFVVKLFQGEGVDAFVKELRSAFGSVRLVKPPASRSESREIYVLARNYGIV
ncbi:MAG TPA: RlmE family RNA methyltransferase [Gammaproteobacteria bacterium]